MAEAPPGKTGLVVRPRFAPGTTRKFAVEQAVTGTGIEYEAPGGPVDTYLE